ncbi:GNAT family N-acetyltransferase [Levilactobacillus spicheri]|uniref:GNAT family acetyltransferase n=1 Tax=Levilactobacillus spicheri TaxID=216463 RepID=A0A0F3RTK9_9LACO|nr:GNAT family N-acetyltransferase [Levilactobacillus spicheri]KJW13348.1 GNAT family acetyltransferase [Levilactobacillus spicheri]
MLIRTMEARDNPAMKQILRDDLRAAGLDIPGTAYDDANLDTLAQFYAARNDRHYWVVENERGEVVGGAGCAAYDPDHGVAELQKVYLRTDARGHGLSYQLIDRVTAFARSVGYQELYLETHHRLAAAIHVYEKLGFHRLPGPLLVASHSTMDRFYLKSLG